MRKAAEGCCGLIVVGVIVVVILIVVGAVTGDTESGTEGTASTPISAIQPTPSPRAAVEALTPESRQAASPTSAAWSELRRNANPALSKLIVDVLLETKVSEPTLTTISRQIRKDNLSYERVDIGYYIKGRGTEGLNWALARFVGSTLDVSIHGFTIEEEQRLMAQSPPDSQEIIGRWIVDGGRDSAKIITILIDSQGVPFLHEISAGGLRAGDLSGLQSELSESPITSGRRFDWVEIFPSNYMVVESGSTGRLLFYGSSGLHRTGYPFPVVTPNSATPAASTASPVAVAGPVATPDPTEAQTSTPTATAVPKPTPRPTRTPRPAATPRPQVTYTNCDDVPTYLLRLDTKGRVAVERAFVPEQPDGDDDGFACGDQLEHKRRWVASLTAAPTATPTPRPTPTPTPRPTPTARPTPSAVTVKTLVEAWDNNSIRADRTYKGRTINIEGHLESISTSFGVSIVNLNDGSQFSLGGVSCTMQRGQENQLATLNKGERIVVRGRVEGLSLWWIDVDDCELLGVYR